MTLVVVERSFERAAEPAALQALEAAAAWCLEQHQVKFLYSYLARDRRHMACVYRAPDAEAVRITQRTATLPFDAVWAAHHLPAEQEPLLPEGYARVVVQRALPVAADVQTVRTLSQQSAECLRRRKAAHIESLLALDGMRMLCAFVAPDAESVREATLESGMPLTRAWPAIRLE